MPACPLRAFAYLLLRRGLGLRGVHIICVCAHVGRMSEAYTYGFNCRLE